ncbi:MAG: hypothetical protein ACK5SI_02775 [Planctomycetia bacterium]
MSIDTIRVHLPCQTLDGFPSPLEEAEADDLLAAWTAAFDPRLLAAAGTTASWASVDLPAPSAPTTLEIVPAAFDDRFAVQADGAIAAGPRVRGIRGREAIVSAALAAAGVPDGASDADLEAEFVALGLATLLSELLARRMRSAANLEASGFGAAVVAAARAAVAGRAAEAREGIRECYVHLETARARYYPVEFWILDLVLLADSTLGRPLRAELEAPVPLGVVASGTTVAALAKHPESRAALRDALAVGRVTSCGGRDMELPPLAAVAAEGVLDSLRAGHAAWREHLDVVPRVYAAGAGCASPFLPQLLDGLGYVGAICSSFDGSRVPEPHAGLIRWDGAGGGRIDAVARRPIDVRTAAAILGLPERISDVLDHDHTAVLALAHHAGTASPWLAALRLAGARSKALGTFVAPEDFFRRQEQGGTTLSFTADDFPPGRPDPADDPVGAAVEAAAREAAGILAAGAAFPCPTVAPPPAPSAPPAGRPAGLWRRLTGRGSRGSRDELLLDNGLVELRVQRESGGMLSLRRPTDRGNRVSQQLAVRSTVRSPEPSRPWSPPEEIAEFTRMRADTVERLTTAAAGECIESRGRLLAAAGDEAATFVQRVSLAPGLPLALFDVEVRLPAPLAGPPLDHHVACRFAWNENDDVRISRSLHTQAVETTRGWFSAPHFVTIQREAARGPDDSLTVLSGGLPWHLITEGHVLDSILLCAGGTVATRRIAVGLDLERPWDLALDFLAGRAWRPPADLPDNVRLTVAAVEPGVGGSIRARVGLLESAGRAGEVRVAWGAEPIRAEACGPDGHSAETPVKIEGRTTVVDLVPYQWLHLDLELRR